MPAQAQDSSVADFRLTPQASPTTSVQGPVDPESPVVTTPSAPTSVASPTPRITPSAAPSARPTPRASATPIPAPTPRAVPSSVSPDTPISSDAAEAPIAEAPLADPAADDLATPVGTPDKAAEPTPESADAAAPAGPSDSLPGWLWLVIAAVPLLGAVMWLGRKPKRAAPEVEIVEAEPVPIMDAPIAPPAPQPAPTPVMSPPTAPAPAPAPTPEPSPVLPSEPMVSPLAIKLEATKISQTLVNALVDYTITISNMSAEPLARIVVGGDLTGAHKSRDQNELLGMDGQPVDALHNLDTLEAGAEAVFKGQLKLPLTATNPIQHQGQTLFVPIARFRCMFARPNDDVLVTTHAYVIGTTGQAASGKLGPFRLDMGPRSQDDISQRAIIVAPQPV